MMENDAVIIENLHKSYKSVEALRGIDLRVRSGEIFGLVGPDGAGKTTLIRILAGILSYNSGEIRVLGKDPRKGLDSIRSEIGYVSQKFNLYSDLTVEENIDFFAALYPLQQDRGQIKKDLLEFIGLAPFTQRLGGDLSGGMKQKLSLLCALIHKPNLLLMDEPTTGVDPVSRREFWEIVFRLQKDGLTVLSSTPYMDEAEQFDRVALIHRGKFINIGTTEQIKKSIPGVVLEVLCPRPERARALLGGVNFVNDVEIFGDKIHIFVDNAGENMVRAVEETLSGENLIRGEIEAVPYSIEDVFLQITAGDSLSPAKAEAHG